METIVASGSHSKFSKCTKISDFLLKWFSELGMDAKNRATFERYYSGYLKKFPRRLQYFYSSQVKEVVEIIKQHKNPKLLDVGCGTGTESLWMAFNGAVVDAIDIKNERLNLARDRKVILEKDLGRDIHCEFKNTSVLDIEGEEVYDIIWLEQAYHHLEPREEVSKKIASLLKPGGYLVISESNGLNPLVQLQLFGRRGFKTIDYFFDENGVRHMYGNERILSARTLCNTFKRHGVISKEVNYYRLFPNMSVFDIFFGLEKRMPKIFTFFFSNYNYVGKKV